MVWVAPVQVQEDPFAVMEVCPQVIAGVLRQVAIVQRVRRQRRLIHAET
jgi:hypothetical protein